MTTSVRARKRVKRVPVPRSALPPDHWSVDDVAAFAGRSKDWVYSQVAAGEIPYSKRGGLLFFDPDTVAKWLVGKPVAVSKARGQ
ncbi:helix-turn-helix domain-containing protein [Pyxidicoccus parkwayensis]|uniref:Helix-turn-helix domain-containing protein n=1 Tax=Pyxidicoccus parkwayensis TaxID=2813578 RepID=A0ABX7P354_9BACT|nr:helix-turn-helix domain-containing protein [Pyxidicoccus parkwaysis]QSQ24892.1 helix-turn-helix domain-containing protein [Pyxidicoccus parkwaysis]